jgi:hypothetical protein
MGIKKISLNSPLFFLGFAMAIISCHTNNLNEKTSRKDIFSYSVDIFLQKEDTNSNPCLRVFTDSVNASRISFTIDSTKNYSINNDRVKYLKKIQESENVTTEWIQAEIITLPCDKKAIKIEYIIYRDEQKIYNSNIYFFLGEIENTIIFRTTNEDVIEQYKRMLKSIRC